ncbi:MAG: response regulator [Treponema sp.]|jgi:signal transduction histidine kinase/HPt (histidine-containing phosphotransfer) domain-containing protein|nr:response regulator [Treponema sp.]
MSSEKQTIIIVDDSQVNLKAGKVILQSLYNVMAVTSGEKLFELLENMPFMPDLILLDVEMPIMNGYEVIKKLKSMDHTRSLPVIFLTALDNKESELEGLTLGALDYLTKPFSAPLLLKRIETHLLVISQTQELHLAKVQAEAASSAKSTFLAHMSHEIRTPLNAVIGMSELMRTDNLDEVQKEQLKTIQDMSKSLLHIINDILDMSKIEAGKMDIVPVHFHLEENFSQLCSAYHYIAGNKDLEFRSSLDPELPEVVYGDEVRMRQIINNIVGNAVKYTRQGFVEFRIEKYVWEGNDWLAVTVKDSGIGIKKEDRDHIFDSFQQLDKEKNRHIQGTGLGLAITLKLVKLLGGTIEFESEYGKGTTFTIYFPLVPGDPEKVTEDAHFERVSAIEDIPVLVVDDNPINLTVALGFLATHNINAETAASGAHALQIIEGKAFDLVFMDHMMPEMDGLETTCKIREWEKKTGHNPMPIIALSANAASGADKLFLDAGMNDFISKPINANELNRILRKWLSPDKIGIAPKDKAGKASLATIDNSEDLLLEELSLIKDFNVKKGLSYTGQNRKSFFMALHQFSDNCNSYIDDLNTALKAEDFRNYSIKAHALKGVLAAFGVEKLSQWAAKLEKASKSGEEFSPEICREESAGFCTALLAFREELNRRLPAKPPHSPPLTNGALSSDTDKKPEGEMAFLREQLGFFEKACKLCSFEEAERIIAGLLEKTWDSKTTLKLERIDQLTSSYDYDQVLDELELF